MASSLRHHVPALALLTIGCAGSRIPDPREAAAEYAAAASRGDARALHDMLSTSSKKALSQEDVDRLVREERPELAELARAVTSREAETRARARVRYGDGEEAALDLERGELKVTSAGTLPGGAATPEGALDQLRRALARRSYAGLVRLLSPATRAAIEADLRSLVTGLERPATLRIETHGDDASAAVPGGHHVKLKRFEGVWRIEDFD